MTTTTQTKSEVIDRVMALSQRCEEYALAFDDKRRRFLDAEDKTIEDFAVVTAAGERLAELRRELRNLLAAAL